MDAREFQTVVAETVKGLPKKFRDALKDVAIVVEPLPRSRGRSLLGLYEGVPITEWGIDYSGKLPDKITLYKENIERYAESPEEVPHVIRETLLHEIAHHFGFEHDRIDEMEERWRKAR
jgi:predicted Zn-dependent protease with MMP-like domain